MRHEASWLAPVRLKIMVKKVEPMTEACMLEVYKLIPGTGTALGPGQFQLVMVPAFCQAPLQIYHAAVCWGHQMRKWQRSLISQRCFQRQAPWGPGCERGPGTGCGFWPHKAQHKAYFCLNNNVQDRKVLRYLNTKARGQ